MTVNSMDDDPRAEIAPREVQVGAETFALLEAGSGPLVLCLHGFPATPWTFRHQLRALSRAGYHVVAPYMRGYARGCLSGPYQPAKWGEDALALSCSGARAGLNLCPDHIAEAYVMLHKQRRTAWTHELDLRPWKETW